MLIKHKWITRKEMRQNPDHLYLFGDNCMRRGYGGQAKECRGEPNAIGIRTKKRPDNRPSSFFTDDEYDENTRMIFEDFKPVLAALNNGRTVIIPEKSLGRGLARLPELAPRTQKFIDTILKYMNTFYV